MVNKGGDVELREDEQVKVDSNGSVLNLTARSSPGELKATVAKVNMHRSQGCTGGGVEAQALLLVDRAGALVKMHCTSGNAWPSGQTVS